MGQIRFKNKNKMEKEQMKLLESNNHEIINQLEVVTLIFCIDESTECFIVKQKIDSRS